MAQSLVLYVKSDARYGRRHCGSNSVFEVAQSVYKCAPNRLSVCGKRAVLREKVVIVATSIRVPRTDESHIRLISLLTAPRICVISSSTDKCSCRSFTKLSAWWLAPLAFFRKGWLTLLAVTMSQTFSRKTKKKRAILTRTGGVERFSADFERFCDFCC